MFFQGWCLAKHHSTLQRQPISCLSSCSEWPCSLNKTLLLVRWLCNASISCIHLSPYDAQGHIVFLFSQSIPLSPYDAQGHIVFLFSQSIPLSPYDAQGHIVFLFSQYIPLSPYDAQGHIVFLFSQSIPLSPYDAQGHIVFLFSQSVAQMIVLHYCKMLKE